MHGLDLFSGIGGITLALQEWIKPVAYCEIEPYCQSVLLQRMQEGDLPKAPIWDDIQTLPYKDLPQVDIMYGGFPCQDISVAGLRKGLEGKRSSLFFQITRIGCKLRPNFIFLENVPAITVRGGRQVVGTLTEMGYDCRWCVISASSIGALHRRERWFLLAYANGIRSQQKWRSSITNKKEKPLSFLCSKKDSNSESITDKQYDSKTVSISKKREAWGEHGAKHWPFKSRIDWQETVSSMGKCSDGLPFYVDRLRALGNSVVPEQVKTAWKILFNMELQNAD